MVTIRIFYAGYNHDNWSTNYADKQVLSWEVTETLLILHFEDRSEFVPLSNIRSFHAKQN